MSDEHRDTEFHNWYAAQYAKSINLAEVEGSSRFMRFVGGVPFADPHIDTNLSGRARVMEQFLTMKLRFPIGPEGYTCMVMSAGTPRTNYAYAYWRQGADLSEPPEYIAISPTFDSRDGEYRRRFIKGNTFLETCDEYAEQLAPFEEAAAEIETAVAVYPGGAHQMSPLEHHPRLAVLALAAMLALDLADYASGQRMGHTSSAYAKLVSTINDLYPDLKGIELPIAFHDALHAATHENSVLCGQKLVPMTVRELIDPFDYGLAVWRELSITRLVSDLIINFISPGFALYNQWTYIEGTTPAVFENAAMAERYARGATAEEAIAAQRDARRYLKKAPQNYSTAELDARMYESLEYAQGHLLMSSTVLMHTMEDVGIPMQSVPTICRTVSATNLAVMTVPFGTLESTTQVLFELAYGAHCLHTKLGLAHTDLHSNNMTWYQWCMHGPDHNAAVARMNPVTVFVAGPRGEADTFVIPACGASACIIDYSRAILGPMFRPRLEHKRSSQYATNFYRDQVNRVMRALHRHLPEYVAARQEALKAAVISNLEAVFPVLCAVDFIAIGQNMAAMLEGANGPMPDAKRPFVVAPGSVELARKLEEVGRELLVRGLHGLAAGIRTVPAFPGLEALDRVFGAWKFGAITPERLRTMSPVDAYNHNNEVRWSESDYAKFPPWGQLDEIERHLGNWKMTDIFDRGVEPFIEAVVHGSTAAAARVDIIAEAMKAREERLDGAPVSTASSWIE